MFIRSNGSLPSAIAQPLWSGAGEAGAAAPTGTPPAPAAPSGTPPANGSGEAPNGSDGFNPDVVYAALEPDTRTWLQNKAFDKSPMALAKGAHELEKMLGGMTKIPGKDAKPEDLDAFYNKLGRPEKPEGYEFVVPTDLPENLPYDGAKANQLKTELHKLGLTKAQASAIHNMYIADAVGGVSGAVAAQKAAVDAAAEKATDALVKRWGPLDSQTAQANFELADRVFNDVPGGQEFLAELQAKGFVGEGKVVLSEPIAVFLANIGGALFKEDQVLRGDPSAVGNPFSDGEHNNLTAQMGMVKNDPDRARSLIAAAGKKPADFGLAT